MATRSVQFFERQFARQADMGDYGLNPFEREILPYLRGEVLDLGCGLGNLALAAARSGCRVLALDASPTAVSDLARRASAEALAVEARQADLRSFAFGRQYDCVVAIGLLMFFACPPAEALLRRICDGVRPGGVAALNVLIDPDAYCLFGRGTLSDAFGGWQTLLSRYEDFPAPAQTLKRFHTLVARRASP
jgi:tellurite methyltransferase